MATTIPEPPQSAPARKHPWHWIVPCVLLFALAIGFAIWAFSLNSELSDQKDETVAVQNQLQATQDDVQAVSDQVDGLSKSISDAGAEASQSAQDSIASLRDRVKAAVDGLKKAEQDAG